MSFSINYLIFCVPTLHINDYRNRDIVLNALIAELITLGVKHHMSGKVPKSKDFYKVPLCSNTIVSTCPVWGYISHNICATASFLWEELSFRYAGASADTPAYYFHREGFCSNRSVMLRRLMPRVERLCSMALVAGGRMPRAPRRMRAELKLSTKR